MLYVFHVDSGQMTTYDMSLTLQNVASLKYAIERKTKVPSNSLVLLISGGEVLISDHMVSSYSAGTDSNPIFMFIKPSVKESHLQQSLCGDLSPIGELSTGEFSCDTRSVFDGKSVSDLRAAVDKCCSMTPNVHTVITCATLAQQFSDLALEVSRSCDQLVHEQHLQHQGWTAVVANLEDIFNEFCERSRNFKESFKKHRLKKEEYHEKLNALNEVLESLGRIPILSALKLNAEAHRFSAFDVFEETDFEGHPYRVSERLDSSSDKQNQDFSGVEAFKLSEEDVFENAKDASSSKESGQSSEALQRIYDTEEGVTFRARTSSYQSNEDLTLLHWILAQGNKASLQDILDYCQKGLALIDAEPLKEREAELYNILEYANNHGLKQIKGIEDRLYGLDQLLNDVKKLERDQRDQAASLIQYRERISSACDPSVLPTLVQSHWCQLQKLLKGHQSLFDIRRRIAKSKEELSHILKARLEAVLKIENSMSVQDAHAMLSFQCFNRLARYFGIVSQLHAAPAVYVRAVHEVARRRTFSQAHLKWATDLAEKLLRIHDEEITRRQDFNTLFEGHFLRSLFPGMTELPPSFAIQAPPTFDGKLPQLTDEDVEFIASTFPQLADAVPSYDMEATVRFFQQRINASQHEEKDAIIQVDFDKDFESEAGDFEKLSRQSDTKQTVDTSTICVPETMAVSMVTEVRSLPVILEAESPVYENSDLYFEDSLPSSLEWGRSERQDNMETHKINIEKFHQFLLKLYELCKFHIVHMMEELVRIKTEINQQKEFVSNECLVILEEWRRNNEATEIKFREETQRLTVDHELELSDMKATLNEKDDTISSLRTEIENIKLEHQKEIDRLTAQHQSTKDLLEETREEIGSFETKLEEAEANKQKEIKNLQEKMHQDYKKEIESLRSRFRLVALQTNMDRSPSESSLEKIERTDMIEISSHNTIVMQTKENAEVEKEEAVRLAVQKCETEWSAKFDAEVASLKTKFDTEKQVTINDVTRRLLSEKDRQLELLREHEQALVKECGKYRDTIQQLTDPETNDYDSLLKTQMATLENQKALLQQQVTDLKKELEKKEDGDKSKEEDSEGSSSSPKKEERRRKKKEEGPKKSKSLCHTPCGLSAGTLSLSSCLPGNTVLVMWDPAHQNYTLMQETSLMFFVHSECLPALDLSIPMKNESERRLYAVATVESKEYCYAKKSGNRFNMPRGSRFYRVRVKPTRNHPSQPPCCDHKHKQDSTLSTAAVDASPAASDQPSTLPHVNEATAAVDNVPSVFIYTEDPLKGPVLPLLGDRPLKKWLTYVHAPDIHKSSIDTSQSTSSATDEANRIAEVAIATLINLESPVSTSEAISNSSALAPEEKGEDQLDSIEAGELWQNSRMQQSTASNITDMESSVARFPGPEPLELIVSGASVLSEEIMPEETAEEASP